jgi:Double zinc ribbon domain
MKRLRPSNAAFSGSITVPMPGVELSAAAEPSREAETAWRKPMRSLLGHIADLLLPPVCISCRARIGSHGLLCGACFAKIDFIAPPICARLGVPVPYDAGEPLLSAAAIAKPPVYDRARAAARYSATMRELIQSFKYRDRHEGLPLFGLWLKKAGAESCRGGPDRAGAALSFAAMVAALQPVGDARAQRRPARRRPSRLLRALPRAAHAKPSWALGRPAAQEGRRGL